MPYHTIPLMLKMLFVFINHFHSLIFYVENVTNLNIISLLKVLHCAVRVPLCCTFVILADVPLRYDNCVLHE